MRKSSCLKRGFSPARGTGSPQEGRGIIADPVDCGTYRQSGGFELSAKKTILFELNEVPPRILDEYCAWHPDAKVDCALLDPELKLGLPSHLTASTGVDALVHAIEVT